MLILGIDPGSRYCGYGLLEIQKKRIIAAGCDVIDVSREKDILKRLNMLYSAVDAILDEYNPDVATVESMFLQRHVRSIFTLGHARGVILLSIARHNLQMLEYSPREIKKAVVGNGNASKQQVRYMVSKQLNLKSAPKRDDAYDALGIALCHYHRIKYEL
ncbi:MAG: crossover junction endodeoxyribonuclease RuvC [Candidatus Cloacimonadota bacterium]|nr:crossover junction endodeoxyribonuclease RuvC [Candidatus Cloacimonadota bacterium]NMD13272.1 crossover junction endodeoxyribonuclease RuvC [Candidatus Cloacimonadota bacterium]